jgi:polar amino acid transport system substrate-binding protein
MVGICFVSFFTATVTTQLTVQQIKSDIGGVTDLPGKRVLTVKCSTAAQYLTNL